MGLNIPQIILSTVFRMKDTAHFDGESNLSARLEKEKKKGSLTTANEGKDALPVIGLAFFNWNEVSRYRGGGRY